MQLFYPPGVVVAPSDLLQSAWITLQWLQPVLWDGLCIFLRLLYPLHGENLQTSTNKGVMFVGLNGPFATQSWGENLGFCFSNAFLVDGPVSALSPLQLPEETGTTHSSVFVGAGHLYVKAGLLLVIPHQQPGFQLSRVILR